MFFQNLKQLLENCLKILVVSHLFWWWSDFLEATHGIPKELPFPVPFRRRHVAHVRHDVGQDLQGRNLWFLFLGVEGNGGEHLQREGMNFSTVKRWRQDSLNDQTKQCQKLWPKPFKNTINLHHVCSRGCTLYTPRFFIMTPPLYQLLLPPPRLLLSSSLLSSLRRLAFAGGVIDPFFGP